MELENKIRQNSLIENLNFDTVKFSYTQILFLNENH